MRISASFRGVRRGFRQGLRQSAAAVPGAQNAVAVRPPRKPSTSFPRPSGPATGSSNGLHPKSNFLAVDLGILWSDPFRIDVAKHLKPGTNTLEVAVTNLWVNRLIGDEQLPADVKWQGLALAK